MRKIKIATSIHPELCGCGCGHVYVWLSDEKGRDYARFSLNTQDWVPFGEECLRIANGETPQGQPREHTLQ